MITETKFSLSDRVTSKKTGLPAIGRVIQTTHPIMYELRGAEKFLTWNELYPDWLEKPLYTVLFDKPQRHMSLDEYKMYVRTKMDEAEDNLSDDDWKMNYENNVELVRMASFPEDDLELLD